MTESALLTEDAAVAALCAFHHRGDDPLKAFLEWHRTDGREVLLERVRLAVIDLNGRAIPVRALLDREARAIAKAVVTELVGPPLLGPVDPEDAAASAPAERRDDAPADATRTTGYGPSVPDAPTTIETSRKQSA